MLIRSLEYQLIRSERKEPFFIATGSSNVAHNIIVKIKTDEGMGIGSACPNSVTGETAESIAGVFKILSQALIGKDAGDIELTNTEMDALIKGNPSAKAGIDIALWDLKGKVEGVPVSELLGGGGRQRMLTDMTIGIMGTEETVEHALLHIKEGFKALKVKIGLDKERDIETIKSVREAVGEDIIVRVDANQGYDVRSAIEVIRAIEPYDIEQIEQPVAWDDLEGLKEVKESSSIPITADEAVKTKEDALKVVENNCADKINIKLMKCGGITKALEINKIAGQNGLDTMIGCMSENVVSIAAGLHFALSQENVKYADLDSHFALIDDKTRGGCIFEEGFLIPLERPGLGVDVEI
ncbi:MAG: dipeptide epimerase [Thermoplasmata archaeon]|nr:MAG: dipeptide epimerase [Thermoplasmata archaeon]